MFVELPEYIFSDIYRRNNIMKLERSLYGLKDVARIWHEAVKESCHRTRLKKLPSASFVLIDNEIILVCYVDEFLMFANINGTSTESNEIKKKLCFVRPGTTYKISWHGNRLDQ